MMKTERNTLIVDAYNANPTSMSAALDNFSTVQADYRIAMLGDMLELGDDSLHEHQEIIGKALACGAQKICLVGEEFRKALDKSGETGNLMHFMTSEDLADWIGTEDISGAVVLIKGSRGVKMEKIIENL